MSQPFKMTMSRKGEFVRAVFECLLCDQATTTDNPTLAMMSVCASCATKEPTRADINRIFAYGAAQRARDLTPGKGETIKCTVG